MPLALAIDLVAAGKALNEQEHIIRSISFPDQIDPRRNDTCIGCGMQQSIAILFAQRGEVPKLSDQNIR